MKYGIFAGLFWALDTVILGIALALSPFTDVAAFDVGALVSASILVALIGAAFHDIFCALWMLVYMAAKRRLKDTAAALKTKAGKVIMLAALLGGPLGMGGYVIAIHNIGPGTTAIISSFYPALGAALATIFLKERMRPVQWVALFAAMAGIIFMGIYTADSQATGNVFLGLAGAIACVVGWGSEALLLAYGMRDAKVDNECALQIRETTSALIYLIVVIPLIGALPSALNVAFTSASAVIGLAAVLGVRSYLFYYRGIAKIGAAKAMAANISYSAWAVIFSLVLLGKVPSVVEIICCVVILCGTTVAATDRKPEKPRAK